MTIGIPEALTILRPGATWTLRGDKFEALEWPDQAQTKPTEVEINDEMARLETAEAAEATRVTTIKADASRAEMLAKLKTATLAEVEAYVRSKIAAGEVTTNAQAIACLKRVETAIVTLYKIVALDARS